MNLASDAIINRGFNGLETDGHFVNLFEGYDLDSLISKRGIELVFRRLHLTNEYLELASDGYIWVRSLGGGKVHITGIHCDDEFRKLHHRDLCGRDRFKFLIDILNNPSEYNVILKDVIFYNKDFQVPSQSQWDKVVDAESASRNFLATEGAKYRTEVVDQHLDMLSDKFYMKGKVLNFPKNLSFEDTSILEEFDDSYELLEGTLVPYELLRNASFKYVYDAENARTIFKRYKRVFVKVEGNDKLLSDQLCMIDDEGRKILRTYYSVRGDFTHMSLQDLGKSFNAIIGYNEEEEPIIKWFYVRPIEWHPDHYDYSWTTYLLITLQSGKFISINPNSDDTIFEDGNLRIQDEQIIAGEPIRSITAYYEITY